MSCKTSQATDAVALGQRNGRNYPFPWRWQLGCDGLQDGAEDAGAWSESGGVDHDADVGSGLDSPHGRVTIDHLALDHRRVESALADIVRGLDCAALVGKSQELIAHPAQPGLERAYQVARCGRGQAGGQVRQGERRGKPELEPERHRFVARLDHVGHVAGKTGQAGLLGHAVPLLGRVAIRQPDLGLVAVYRLAHDRGRSRWSGVVHHHLRQQTEHPVAAGATLDPDPSLVGSNHLSATERGNGLLAPSLEATLGAVRHVHRPTLANGQAEQASQRRLQPLVKQTLEGLRASGHPDRHTDRGSRRCGRNPSAAAWTLHAQAAAMLNEKPDWRPFNPLVHADRLARQIRGQHKAAARVLLGGVIDNPVRVGAEHPAVALVPELGTSRLGLFAPSLAVRGQWLGRRARGFSGRCSRSTNSINLSLLSRSSSLRCMPTLNQRCRQVAREWVIINDRLNEFASTRIYEWIISKSASLKAQDNRDHKFTSAWYL